jgi:ABC-type transport system involved in multi-copper enzyme maturation permease subunit
MNAITSEPMHDSPTPSIVVAGERRFAGFATLVRKDLTEWRRGQRAIVVAGVSTVFMSLTAANAWITTRIIESLPAGAEAPALPPSMAPLDNLLAAVGSQIFILVAIFAVGSLLIRERESGTLAWVASKPVDRGIIWAAKWASAAIVLAIAGVIIPFTVTTVAVSALYGAPDLSIIATVTVGAIATVILFAAFGLAVSTRLPGQVPTVAAGFALFAVSPIIGGLIPGLEPVLPTSILGWSIGAAMGASVGVVTPIAWAVGVVALAIVATQQMRRLEL